MPFKNPTLKNNHSTNFEDSFDKEKEFAQHAALLAEQNSLARGIEDLKAEIRELNKNRLVFSSSAVMAHSSSGGPTVVEPLIPKPAGEAGRSAKNHNKPGYNLQDAMGLTERKDLYNSIRVRPLLCIFSVHILEFR
jgi:hypothetical protein